MALSSRTKHLLALFGWMLLAAADPGLARAQRNIPLSDSLLANVDELPLTSGSSDNYRFGEFRVLSRKGGVVTSHARDRGPLLDRRGTVRYESSIRYAVKDGDSLTVSVSVRDSGGSEVQRPILSIGHPPAGPDDTLETADVTIATIVFEDDTAGAWHIRMDRRTGTRVPGRSSIERTITNGLRTIRLVPVSEEEQPRRRVRDWFVVSAFGLLLEEEGRVFAAVQLFGQRSPGSPLGERVWMPKGLSARARLELAAIFTVLLARVRIRDV